ncbi:heme-binding protein [Azospirillum sp.]|uniref:GlcG/HbpS family heme-binding protein n=1 Tax=Azospirillum sp. TaxID=34012 RepID=UPI002D4E997C|nr:heme-binding protein [Azospirillum sp.]HYD71116.1 heme-binding protein [Azospirillum sp.]HYH23190.1 heme-binding protein [Azospirillum sp.]
MTITIAAAQLAWDAAQSIVGAALRHAQDLGIRVSVAVVDAGGRPLAFGRMNGAPFHTVEIAQDKAFTAASFGLPTAALAQGLARQPDHVRHALTQRPRLVTLAGGLPIHADGMLLGAVGVSGGSEEQDVACAATGLACIATI